MDIEFIDARNPNAGIADRVYHPTPETNDNYNYQQIQSRSNQPIRILLWQDHYYPVVPRGTFPNQGALKLAHPPMTVAQINRVGGNTGSIPLMSMPQDNDLHFLDDEEIHPATIQSSLLDSDLTPKSVVNLATTDPLKPQIDILGTGSIVDSDHLILDSPNHKTSTAHISSAIAIQKTGETTSVEGPRNAWQQTGTVVGVAAAVGLGIAAFAGLILGVNKLFGGLKQKKKMVQGQKVNAVNEQVVTNAKW